jgi:hypothetical protein
LSISFPLLTSVFWLRSCGVRAVYSLAWLEFVCIRPGLFSPDPIHSCFVHGPMQSYPLFIVSWFAARGSPHVEAIATQSASHEEGHLRLVTVFGARMPQRQACMRFLFIWVAS